MVLCMHNEGSNEVMRDIPEAFYSSNEELFREIHEARNISKDDLLKYYRLISQRYSREAVSERFLRLVHRQS